MTIWLIIASVASGLIAGMGMGGGTLLIPVLTIFFSVEQRLAQGINLFAFLPTAVVSLIIHMCNHLVDYKKGLFMILGGVGLSVVGSLLAIHLNQRILQIMFGVFLIVLALFQIGVLVYQHFHNKTEGKSRALVITNEKKDVQNYKK